MIVLGLSGSLTHDPSAALFVDGRLVAAVAVAEDWPDRAIAALGDSGDRRWYDWRFPSPHIELVRERCRLRVAEFVRTWLLHEDHWRPDRFLAITVRFEDDPPQASTPGPTILWDELPSSTPQPS